jgi:uncharacterized protein (TIGR03089 family)
VVPVAAPLDPADLLTRAKRRDGSRPLITYYDLDSGGRTELSVATVENWVAKTAGMLFDELDVTDGDVVDVDLPAHWLGLVVLAATWTLGAAVVLPPAAGGTPGSGASAVAAVRVRAAHEVNSREARGSDGSGLVVTSTRPLGGPAGMPLPPGAVDLGRDVLGYPDVLAVPLARSQDALLGAATLAPGEPGARRLVVASRLDSTVAVDALLVPLRDDGSVVLVCTSRPVNDDVAAAPDIAAIAADERVSITRGRRSAPPPG